MISKLNEIDKDMEIGKAYRISDKLGTCGRKRKASFNAKLIKKMDRFYVFILDEGYKECIMKVDFITGDYILEGNLT